MQKQKLGKSGLEVSAIGMCSMNLNKMDSQIVIPEAILIGNPDCNSLKSWMPDKVTRA